MAVKICLRHPFSVLYKQNARETTGALSWQQPGIPPLLSWWLSSNQSMRPRYPIRDNYQHWCQHGSCLCWYWYRILGSCGADGGFYFGRHCYKARQRRWGAVRDILLRWMWRTTSCNSFYKTRFYSHHQTWLLEPCCPTSLQSRKPLR